MSVNLSLELPDVNTVLEGLARVQENSNRVAAVVRDQANAQLQAQQEADAAAEKAANPEPAPQPGE